MALLNAAPSAGKVALIGYLVSVTATTSPVTYQAFTDGLPYHGWIEGRTS
jgi:hypothetical protein